MKHAIPLAIFLLLIGNISAITPASSSKSFYHLARIKPDSKAQIEMGPAAFSDLDTSTLFLATNGDEYADVILYTLKKPSILGRVKSSEIEFIKELNTSIQEAYYSKYFGDFIIMSEQWRKALRFDRPHFPDDPDYPKLDSLEKFYVDRHEAYEDYYIKPLLEFFPEYFNNAKDEANLNRLCSIIYLNKESVNELFPHALGACFETNPRLVNCALNTNSSYYSELEEALLGYLDLNYSDKNNSDSLNAKGKVLEASIAPISILVVYAGLGDSIFVDGHQVNLKQVRKEVSRFLLRSNKTQCSVAINGLSGETLLIPNSVILLTTELEAYYNHFIDVQAEVKRGYDLARDQLSLKIYGVSYFDLLKHPESNSDKIKHLEELLPVNIQSH